MEEYTEKKIDLLSTLQDWYGEDAANAVLDFLTWAEGQQGLGEYILGDDDIYTLFPEEDYCDE